MNPELTELLRANGWGAPYHESPAGWYSIYPLEDVPTPAPVMVNLLRLGGYKVAPNRKDPTRFFIRLSNEPPSP